MLPLFAFDEPDFGRIILDIVSHFIGNLIWNRSLSSNPPKGSSYADEGRDEGQDK